MWSETAENVAELKKKILKIANASSYSHHDKEDIVNQSIVKAIVWVRSIQRHGSIEKMRVLAMANTFFNHAVIDLFKKHTFRDAVENDRFTEDKKWPAIEYILNQAGEIDIRAPIKPKHLFLCAFRSRSIKTDEDKIKAHAFTVTQKTINEEINYIADHALAEFLKLGIWKCNKGNSLMELAKEAGFIGRPTLERKTFISGVNFLLESNGSNWTVVLANPSSIQILTDATDTCDVNCDADEEITQFTILPDNSTNIERSVYLSEVSKIIQNAFNEAIDAIKSEEQAKFFYNMFWSTFPDLTMKETAEICGVPSNGASQMFKRFCNSVNELIQLSHSEVCVDIGFSSDNTLHNQHFSAVEIESVLQQKLGNNQ
jgi:hypothetical protein